MDIDPPSSSSTHSLSQRDLSRVHHDLAQLKGSPEVSSKQYMPPVEEKTDVEAPSEVFEDSTAGLWSPNPHTKHSIKPADVKIGKVELPFLALMNQMFQEMVTPHVRYLVKYGSAPSHKPNSSSTADDFTRTFPPLAAEPKRMELFHQSLKRQYLSLQNSYQFPSSGLTWIHEFVRCLQYPSAIRMTKKESLLCTILAVFLCSKTDEQVKKKLDEHMTAIKRTLRVDCEMRRGFFETLMNIFDSPDDDMRE